MTLLVDDEIADLLASPDEDPLAWMTQGVCAQADPELFFPMKGVNAEPARRMCLKCPVRTTCLDYALQGRENDGIWGALTERERRAVLSGRKNAVLLYEATLARIQRIDELSARAENARRQHDADQLLAAQQVTVDARQREADRSRRRRRTMKAARNATPATSQQREAA